MTGRYELGKNLLITYTENFKYYDEATSAWVSHPDPTFEIEWSYCTGHERLLKCGKENYVFFHTTKPKYRERFITAYFVIKDKGPGQEIVPKHDIKGAARHAEGMSDHYVIVGDEKLSRKLSEPGLRFNNSLAERLVFEPPKRIRFGITNRNGRKLSDLECIASATRNIRILTNDDVETLLAEINRLRL